MFARFDENPAMTLRVIKETKDENPAMTLRVIKETKRYGRTDNVKTVYPLQTKFAGGITINLLCNLWLTTQVRSIGSCFLAGATNSQNSPYIKSTLDQKYVVCK